MNSLDSLVKYTPITAQTQDPWQPWAQNNKHTPPVPEPNSYGAILIASALAVLVYRTYFKRPK